MKKLADLEKKIGLNFHDKKLLENVFIHRSYLNEHKNFTLPSNEKLEFLGDSVLSLVTSVYLYKHYPTLEEGEYTEVKAAIVRTESLARAALELNLGTYLFLSKGQDKENGRSNKNLLADCFEALIGAIFIDLGFENSYSFIFTHLFGTKLDYIVKNRLYLSPKSRLQEYTQAKFKIIPEYKVIEELGPEHNRLFKVSVFILDKNYGSGTGKSKKEAEELAAKKAMEKIT